MSSGSLGGWRSADRQPKIAKSSLLPVDVRKRFVLMWIYTGKDVVCRSAVIVVAVQNQVRRLRLIALALGTIARLPVISGCSARRKKRRDSAVRGRGTGA